MRLYVVDQLTEENIRSIITLLRNKEMESGVEGLFWLLLPDELLTDAQREHRAECGPYALGLEIFPDSIKLELLARAKNRLHCGCITYANAEQRAFAIEWIDSFLHELDIPV
jgi:hypothetical protein